MEQKVTIKSLNSANLRIDNSVDADRVYDIEASVNISTGNYVQSIDSGSVKKEMNEVATFSSWGSDNLQINYNGVKSEEQCAIITAVNQFIADTRAKATEGSMLPLTYE